MFWLSTSTCADGRTVSRRPGHPGGDPGWPAARLLLPGTAGTGAQPATSAATTSTGHGARHGARPAGAPPLGRDARPVGPPRRDRAGEGTGRTAPPRRARRWPRPRTGDRRDSGGTPGWRGGPSAPARALPAGPPAARRARGGSRPGSRRRPPRRPGPASRAPPRPPTSGGPSGPRRTPHGADVRPAGPAPHPGRHRTAGSSGSTVSGRPVVRRTGRHLRRRGRSGLSWGSVYDRGRPAVIRSSPLSVRRRGGAHSKRTRW